MGVLPQTLLISKKSVKHVKLRTAAKQQPLSEKALNATVTELRASPEEETKRSLENTPPAPLFRNARAKSKSSPEITIEKYIDSKKGASSSSCHNSNNLEAFLPSIHHQSQSGHVSGENSTLTVAAQDEAYSYLFQTLAGNCHGLNLVAYPSLVSVDGDANDENGTSKDVHIAAVVYINSGTACRDWKGIESQLERIFKKAAAEKNGKKPAWQFEGVIFVVWEAK